MGGPPAQCWCWRQGAQDEAAYGSYETHEAYHEDYAHAEYQEQEVATGEEGGDGAYQDLREENDRLKAELERLRQTPKQPAEAQGRTSYTARKVDTPRPGVHTPPPKLIPRVVESIHRPQSRYPASVVGGQTMAVVESMEERGVVHGGGGIDGSDDGGIDAWARADEGGDRESRLFGTG